jgi:hypothetical protein
MGEPRGPAGRALLDVIHHEQRFNAFVSMPLTAVFYLIAGLVIQTWSQFFLDQNGHLIFGALQLVGAILYLAYVAHFFRRISGLILAARQERSEDPVNGK